MPLLNFNKNQKGSVILYSLLMLGVILTITLTLVRIYIPKLRAANDSVNSTSAIYVADSAAELCLYEARRLYSIITPTPTPFAYDSGTGKRAPIFENYSGFGKPGFDSSDVSFSIASRSNPEVVITDNCIGLKPATFSFRAVGEYRGVTRALEVSQ